MHFRLEHLFADNMKICYCDIQFFTFDHAQVAPAKYIIGLVYGRTWNKVKNYYENKFGVRSKKLYIIHHEYGLYLFYTVELCVCSAPLWLILFLEDRFFFGVLQTVFVVRTKENMKRLSWTIPIAKKRQRDI